MVLSLHGQDDLADIFPFLNVGMSRGGFRQRKRFADYRLDFARGIHTKNLVKRGAQQTNPPPHPPPPPPPPAIANP
jgi:hypothetical protein